MFMFMNTFDIPTMPLPINQENQDGTEGAE